MSSELIFGEITPIEKNKKLEAVIDKTNILETVTRPNPDKDLIKITVEMEIPDKGIHREKIDIHKSRTVEDLLK